MSDFENLECVQIESAVDAIRYRKEAYLRTKGWDHTSSTVGCYWMWFKTVNERHYGCCTEDAFRIQSVTDRQEYESAHQEEFED